MRIASKKNGAWVVDNFPNCVWKKNSVVQSAEIMNGSGSGRIDLTGDMVIEPDSVFLNYTGTILRGKNCSPYEWDKIFAVLTSPINDHYICFPQQTEYSNLQQFLANSSYIYISSAERKLIKRNTTRFYSSSQNWATSSKGINEWANSLDIAFTAMIKEQ